MTSDVRSDLDSHQRTVVIGKKSKERVSRGPVVSLSPLIKLFTNGVKMIGTWILDHSLPDLIQILLHSCAEIITRCRRDKNSSVVIRIDTTYPVVFRNLNLIKLTREFLPPNVMRVIKILPGFLVET